MNEPRDLNELRDDAEARQKNILWEDQFRNNRNVTSFLWRGDPNARPVQRAGLLVFGLLFLVFPVLAVSSWFENGRDERSFLAFVFALVCFVIAGRLFRNALVKPVRRSKEGNDKNT
jgi:hypothetical protein